METDLVTMPTNLIAQAIEKGATIETLEKLMALQERFEASENRKKFFNALSSFQSNCPVLKKTKLVSFKDVKYKYAPLSEIVKQIKDLLGKNGLTYRWEIKDDGKSLNVNCIVTHTSGHSEQTSMSASADKPEKSIDEMHAEYMKYFNILFQSDPAKYGKYSPDNWKSERTIENYKKAIPRCQVICSYVEQ